MPSITGDHVCRGYQCEHARATQPFIHQDILPPGLFWSSVDVQALYENPEHFYNNHRDHFDFTVAALKGWL